MVDETPAGQSPEEIYARLTPEQRAEIAKQFQAGFQQSDHPVAQQYAAIDPQAATPEQVAEMHKHAREEHKGLFGVVMNHPVASVALGAFAAYEIEKHINNR